MSRATHAIPEVSRAQMERLEAERQRLLEEERRRQEDQRRRELERLRREDIIAEKQRIDTARRFREMSSAFPGRMARRAPQHISAPSSTTRADIRHIVQSVKERLEAIPEAWCAHFSEPLDSIRSTIRHVEASDFDPYLYLGLLSSQRQLARIEYTGADELARHHEDFIDLRKQSEELRLVLQVVLGTSVVSDQRRQAQTITHALKALDREPDAARFRQQLGELADCTERLRTESEQSLEQHQVYRLVLDAAARALSDMGYVAIDDSSGSCGTTASTLSKDAPIWLFRTPEHGVVELSSGPMGLAAEYTLPVRAGEDKSEIDHDEAVAGCAAWCTDYDQLLLSLAQEGIQTRDVRRVDPSRDAFRLITLSDDHFQGPRAHRATDTSRLRRGP